jgi:hypothetical protein
MLVEAAGLTYAAAGWDRRYLEDQMDADVWIVKEHRYFHDLATLADMVLTTSRDWGHIRASWERFKGEAPDDAQVDRWRADLAQWRSKPNHVADVGFEWIGKESAFILLAGILRTAGVILDRWKMDAAWDRLCAIEPPDEGYDDETFLFHNHITSQ